MKVYTIRDIAQKAGVSVTTVSRVLNQRPDVSPATRDRVSRVIEECGFVPNQNAINLKLVDAEIAAIIVRGHSNPFLNGIAEQILQYATDADVNFLVEYIDEQSDEFQTLLRFRNEKHASGFILIGSGIGESSRAVAGVDVPIVFATIDASASALANAYSVTIDDRAMGRRVADCLLDMGHRRIGILGAGREGNDGLAQRYLGMQDGFAARGLDFNETFFIPTRFSIQGAYDCAWRFCALHDDVTALFCMSDLIAFGAMRALRDLGRQVPKDVSVVGFDGIEMSAFTIPSLTTVRQPIDEIARASLDVLLAAMHHEECPRLVRLDAEFIRRESVAAPKS